VNIFKVFLFICYKKPGTWNVSSQAILKPLDSLVDLAETEGAGRKPTKAIEFSPHVTQAF